MHDIEDGRTAMPTTKRKHLPRRTIPMLDTRRLRNLISHPRRYTHACIHSRHYSMDILSLGKFPKSATRHMKVWGGGKMPSMVQGVRPGFQEPVKRRIKVS